VTEPEHEDLGELTRLMNESFNTAGTDGSTSAPDSPGIQVELAAGLVAPEVPYPTEISTLGEEPPAWTPTVADEAAVADEAVRVSDVSDIHIAEALSGYGASWEATPTPAAGEAATPPPYTGQSEESIVARPERAEGEESSAPAQPTPVETVVAQPSSVLAEPETADAFAPSNNGLPATTEDRETEAAAETYVSWGEPDPVTSAPVVSPPGNEFTPGAHEADDKPDAGAPSAPVVSSPGTELKPRAHEADEVPDAWGPTVPVGEEVFFGKRTGRRRGGS
jgi:hypothetical protein